MRDHCYTCDKPITACICGSVVQVAHRTRLTVIQHPRERHHPFGTVRFVRLGLGNAQVIVAGPRELEMGRAEILRASLPPRSAVLFPSPAARDAATLAPAERPEHVIVLDGTWHHAKTLLHALPWLHDLPHLTVHAPPSRYRIRREPAEGYVATLEAIVAMLSALEPDNTGFAPLLDSFARMIDDQLARRGTPVPRQRKRRLRRGPPIEPGLRQTDRLVLVYGDVIGEDTGGAVVPSPLYWTAARPVAVPLDIATDLVSASRAASGSRETNLRVFAAPTTHLAAASEQRRQHLALTIADKPWLDEPTLATRFAEFCGPNPVIAAWSSNNLAIVRRLLAGQPHETILLKATYCNTTRKPPLGLDGLPAELGLTLPDVGVAGRAGQRLAATVALWQWFLRLEAATGVSAAAAESATKLYSPHIP